MKKFIAVLLACVVLIAILSSCSSPSNNTPDNSSQPAENITVVFIPKLTGSPFFDAANEGAQAYAAEHGFTVEYNGNPEANATKQLEIINDVIARKVDAICISSLDAAVLDAPLKEAMRAGIKVTTWDSDVAGDARSIMISQGTPDQLGQMLVEMGAKSLAERGKNLTGDTIRYVWHYSQSSVTDQNSWQIAGEKYIRETYPNWQNVEPNNYYSEQNKSKAVAVGAEILRNHQDIDLIICNDSTALPGQAEAAANLGLNAEDVTITGFAPPNALRDYCKQGIVQRWGLWDCQVQGALGCYLAYYLAAGNPLKVGDRINVPQIGLVEVMPNTVLDAAAYTSDTSGVVLLPSRTEFTIENVDDYNF